MVSAPPADDGEAVLEKIMADGTFDDLRHQIVDVLKDNPALKAFMEQRVANSRAMKQPGVDKLSKRELFSSLKEELEKDIAQEAMREAWKLLTPPGGTLSTVIEEKVHAALCTVYREREAQAAQAGDHQGANKLAGGRTSMPPPTVVGLMAAPPPTATAGSSGPPVPRPMAPPPGPAVAGPTAAALGKGPPPPMGVPGGVGGGYGQGPGGMAPLHLPGSMPYPAHPPPGQPMAPYYGASAGMYHQVPQQPHNYY